MIEKSDAASIFRDTRGSRVDRDLGSWSVYGGSDFPVSRKIPELLPLNAADLLCSRPLTKTEDKDTITLTAQADPLISKRNLSKQAEPPPLLERDWSSTGC